MSREPERVLVIKDKISDDIAAGSVVKYNMLIFDESGNVQFLNQDGTKKFVNDWNYAFSGERTVSRMDDDQQMANINDDEGNVQPYYREELLVKGVDYT
jgi:hypothetical protein